MLFTVETVLEKIVRSLRTLLAACLSVVAITPVHLAEARIIEFDPPQSINTTPYSINKSGAVVGYYLTNSNGPSHGFLRASNGVITTLDAPKAKCGTDAMSINQGGEITGVYKDASCMAHGYVRAVDGTITTFDVGGATETAPESIDDAGIVTGFYEQNNVLHGFLRAADGKITTFDPERSTQTIPININKSGVITGVYNLDVGFVRAANGTIITFLVDDSATYPNCVNDGGYIVGYDNFNDVANGFLRAPDGTITTIDLPGAVETVAAAINDKGAITGAYDSEDGMQHGFVRSTKGKYTTFDPKGSKDTFPNGINKHGAITGWWADSNSQMHGFVRTP
jgi:hypothetical protein